MPEPTQIPLPSGRCLDLCELVDADINLQIARGSFGAAVELCREAPTVYWQEALVQSFIDANRRTPHLEEWSKLGLGIHPRHRLFQLREEVRERVEGQRWAYPGEALILWGASAKAGKALYREAGVLMRTPGLRQRLWLYPEHYLGLTMHEVVNEWGRASGVSKGKPLDAIDQMAEDALLSLPPAYMYASIDEEAIQLAQHVASGDPRLGVAFCRCLMRIAAVSVNNKVRWQSTWLRGTGTNPDAIPGASTYSKELKGLLDEHVFEKVVKNYSAGKRATTYRLKKPIRRGSYTAENVATFLGLELGEDGVPVRAARRR